MSEAAAGPGAGRPRTPGPPRDLPDAVLSRRDDSPEEPALFYPDGFDVRWRSWRALAEQMAGGAAALAALGLPPAAPVAFRWRAVPDAVAADLAIQAAGLTAAPVGEEGEAAAAGCAAWLLAPGEEAAPAGELPAARLPAAAEPLRGSRKGSGAGDAGGPGMERAAGGVRVVEPGLGEAGGRAGGGGPGEGGRVLAPEEVLRRARALGERLERAVAGAEAAVRGARRPEREIALASFDLRAADGRSLLAWALVTGAALLLEPDPRALPGSAAWARPTLVAAPARALPELGRQVRRREEGRPRRPRLLGRRARPRLPFGRLRAIAVLGEGRLPMDDLAYWAGRGVAVVRVSDRT